MRISTALPRVALAASLALALLPAGAYAGTGAERTAGERPTRPLRGGVSALAVDDDIPGVPIPASPINDTVAEFSDYDDVFSVYLNAGDTFEATLGFASTDNYASIWLWDRGSTDMATGDVVDSKADGWNLQYISYTVPAGESGTYYVDIYGETGTTDYSLEWAVNESLDRVGGVDRYWGFDRYETAIQTSEQTFPNGSSSWAVIATGQNFADALAASGLCGELSCPLLLTRTLSLPTFDGDPTPIQDELDRLGVTDVYVVGGTGAVSPAVATALATHLGGAGHVTRLWGDTRYETALEIAAEIQDLSLGNVSEAFVVPGNNWPDALAASPFAYANRMPILLTPTDVIDPGVATFVSTYCTNGTVVVGGTLSPPITTYLGGLPGGTTVLAGLNRYQSASMLAGTMVTRGYNGFDYVGIATGDNYADALGGGVAAGANNGVLLLTPSPGTTDPALNAVTAGTMTDELFYGDDAVIYGGYGAIGFNAEGDLWDIVSSAPAAP